MYPILAIDFGKKHIGIAISDFNGKVATPLDVIDITKNTTYATLTFQLKEICNEYGVKSILIGKPQSFEKEHEKNIERIDSFVKEVVSSLLLPIETWDESFSTSEAKNVLISQGVKMKKGKRRIDSIAASVFLQEFLNSKEK